jgi:hypothetical protein
MNLCQPEEGSKQCLCFHLTYKKLTIFTKIVQILASLLLLAEVILRFVYFLQLGSLSNYILTFYFLVFSFYLVGFELGMKSLKLKFYLMNFAWGKAAMDFFLGSLVVASWVIPALDVFILIFFFLASISLLLISCMFRAEEKDRVDAELQ